MIQTSYKLIQVIKNIFSDSSMPRKEDFEDFPYFVQNVIKHINNILISLILKVMNL